MNVAYEQFYKEADGDFMPQIMCFTKNEEGKIIAIDRSSEHGGKNVLVKNQEQPVTSNPYIACFNQCCVERGAGCVFLMYGFLQVYSQVCESSIIK